MVILAVIISFALVGIMLRLTDRGPNTFQDETPGNTVPSRMTGWCATAYFTRLEEEGLLRDDKNHGPPEENENTQ